MCSKRDKNECAEDKRERKRALKEEAELTKIFDHDRIRDGSMPERVINSCDSDRSSIYAPSISWLPSPPSKADEGDFRCALIRSAGFRSGRTRSNARKVGRQYSSANRISLLLVAGWPAAKPSLTHLLWALVTRRGVTPDSKITRLERPLVNAAAAHRGSKLQLLTN